MQKTVSSLNILQRQNQNIFYGIKNAVIYFSLKFKGNIELFHSVFASRQEEVKLASRDGCETITNYKYYLSDQIIV